MRDRSKRATALRVVSVLGVLMAVAATGAQPGDPDMRGSLLINIHYIPWHGKFIEFKLQDGGLVETSKGDVINMDKEKNIPYSDWSNDFKRIYNSERRYHYEQEEKLAAIMSQFDLERVDNLTKRFFRNKGMAKDKYALTGPGQKFKYFWGKYADHFLPNKQFSQVIYYKPWPSTATLLDLAAKEISFPFGIDRLQNPVWNKDGRYVAYSAPNTIDVWDKTGRYIETQKNKDDRYPSILVIQDISTGRTLLRKDIEQYVDDITWSPDSSAVALITYTDRKSKSLGDLIPAIAGHPYFIKTYSLKIYDLSGNLIYHEKIKGTFRSGGWRSRGRLVWSR
jgi:hypothetical protein